MLGREVAGPTMALHVEPGVATRESRSRTGDHDGSTFPVVEERRQRCLDGDLRAQIERDDVSTLFGKSDGV